MGGQGKFRGGDTCLSAGSTTVHLQRCSMALLARSTVRHSWPAQPQPPPPSPIGGRALLPDSGKQMRKLWF